MRVYSDIDQETLWIRRLLGHGWAYGVINESQRALLERDAETSLRRTNGFLRVVLFLFTAGGVAAAAALTFQLWSIRERTAVSAAMFIFAGLSYGLAELAVARGRLYRHGIEEALAAAAVLFFCLGLQNALFAHPVAPLHSGLQALVPAAGATVSFWVYRRFGYLYAALTALVLLAFVPYQVLSSPEAARMTLAGLYAVGIFLVRAAQARHGHDYLEEEYGALQAMCWLALYLTFNLQLPSWARVLEWATGRSDLSHFSRPFYWVTYGLIWALPAFALMQALKEKVRPLLSSGIVMGLLTLITNKPYLGWPRHSWDSMVLGLFLVGIAVSIRHWLAKGPNGVRSGFTAQQLSGADKRFMALLGSASGLISPAPGAAPGSKPEFGGGQSGGGGASGNY